MTDAATTEPTLRERILGCVLGAAIGDAMGHATEFLSMDQIRERYGPQGAEGFGAWGTRPASMRTGVGSKDDGQWALYTDDTQLAELVLTGLVLQADVARTMDVGTEAQSFEAIMQGRIGPYFTKWEHSPRGGHRAPGNACRAGSVAFGKLLDQGREAEWRTAGGASAGGCGSVMRAYPFGFGLIGRGHGEAVAMAAEHSKITHGDPIALASCGALASMIWRLIHRDAATPDIMGEAVTVAHGYDEGTSWMLEDALTAAAYPGDDHADGIYDRFRGWAAHEALAAGVFAYLRHNDDPQAAILEAANTPGDSDSIATIAGALVGAHRGVKALPRAWVAQLERSLDLFSLADRAATLVAHRCT